jgi:hypothetical protein
MTVLRSMLLVATHNDIARMAGWQKVFDSGAELLCRLNCAALGGRVHARAGLSPATPARSVRANN